MRGAIAAIVLILVGTASAGTAAMSRAQAASVQCRVVAGEKYLKAPVGSVSICAEIARAVTSQAPKARVETEVTVLSPSRLAATLVVNRHALPGHKFAVMDSDLSEDAVRRFAHSLGLAAADSVKR